MWLSFCCTAKTEVPRQQASGDTTFMRPIFNDANYFFPKKYWFLIRILLRIFILAINLLALESQNFVKGVYFNLWPQKNEIVYDEHSTDRYRL